MKERMAPCALVASAQWPHLVPPGHQQAIRVLQADGDECADWEHAGSRFRRAVGYHHLPLHPPHRRRLGLAEQRCLPWAVVLYRQPEDGSTDCLCGLSLVMSHNLLVAQVLHPLALLAADLGGVLPALHDCVPLSARGESRGDRSLDDRLKRHTSSLPGSVSPTPTSSSSPRILTASAFPTAHSRRRARSRASSRGKIASDGPSPDTTMRTWPLCVGCTMIVMSRPPPAAAAPCRPPPARTFRVASTAMDLPIAPPGATTQDVPAGRRG